MMKDQSTRQQGAALITSLIFLTVLTMLGMTTLGTALLESRMAGNARDKNLAFQSAEMGLRDAESYIRNSGRIYGHYEVGHDLDPSKVCDHTPAKKCDAESCVNGFCYNGGDMNKDGTGWSTNAVWNGVSYWANALQYALDEVSVAGSGDGAIKIAGYAARNKLSFNKATGNCALITGNCQYSQPAPLPLVRRQPEYLIEGFCKDCSTAAVRYFYRITVRGYGMRAGTQVLLQEVFRP